jgi:hypothetical protein
MTDVSQEEFCKRMDALDAGAPHHVALNPELRERWLAEEAALDADVGRALGELRILLGMPPQG